jgi:hypothetical protein
MASQQQTPATDAGAVAPDADVSVIDDEHYSHKRRLRAIHDAQEHASEVRRVVEDQLISGGLTEQQARRYYRGAVESFIMEVMPVLRDDGLDFAEDYLDGVHLGTVTIEPPEEFVEFARAHVDRMPPGAGVPTPVAMPVVGLRDILELPSPLGKEFSCAIYDGRESTDIHRTQVTTELPRDILDSAFEETTQALEDADIGLKIGEGRPSNQLASEDGQWPWERDDLLPHEIHDAIERSELSKEDLMALIESAEEVDDDAAE